MVSGLGAMLADAGEEARRSSVGGGHVEPASALAG